MRLNIWSTYFFEFKQFMNLENLHIIFEFKKQKQFMNLENLHS